MSSKALDLVVVGGGITGAGIARDAILRGLSVQLFEKHDFASGTSSRSSKLIHGGLRYLEHGELALVTEACSERALLQRQLAHIVRPISVRFPVYAEHDRSLWMLRAGVALYDLVALGRRAGPSRWLRKRTLLKDEPELRADGLRGGVAFADCQSDDARLCLEVLRDAQDRGARLHNYCEVRSIRRHDGAWRVQTRDPSGETASCDARMVINATGPWSDETRACSAGRNDAMLQPSRGTHILLRRSLTRHPYLLPSPHGDGRVVFVLPWSDDVTMIGTTDVDAPTSDQFCTVTKAEVDYLVDCATNYFPKTRVTSDDVAYAFAGTRPLARSDSTSLQKTSREHRVLNEDGLISIIGGKYTTFRVMAEDALDAALEANGVRAPQSCTTRLAPYAAGHFDHWERFLSENSPPWTVLGVAPDCAEALLRRYGARHLDLLELIEANPELGQPLAGTSHHLRAEVVHAVAMESAHTLSDIVVRRLGLSYSPDGGRSAAHAVAQEMTTQGLLSAEDAEAQLKTFLNQVSRWSNT